MKRQRSAERPVENLLLDPLPTPKFKSLVTPSHLDSFSVVKNEHSYRFPDAGSQDDVAGSTSHSLSNVGEGYGDDGVHTWGIGDELLQSPRHSIKSFQRVENEDYEESRWNERERVD